MARARPGAGDRSWCGGAKGRVAEVLQGLQRVLCQVVHVNLNFGLLGGGRSQNLEYLGLLKLVQLNQSASQLNLVLQCEISTSENGRQDWPAKAWSRRLAGPLSVSMGGVPAEQRTVHRHVVGLAFV